MVNIFEEAKETVMPSWMKFQNPGDSVQGTYVGKILGQIDGYGNEQIVYQLLQEDGSVMNVGFGLNKKFINADMAKANFGQIVGFKYKGKITIKDKFGKAVEVKDVVLHQDPKIVNEAWLKDNAGNMPKVTQAAAKTAEDTEDTGDFKAFDNVADAATEPEDVPFSTPSSLTKEDQLAVIQKLAKDKLGATDEQSTKEKVMEVTGIAFIPVNYTKIAEKLAAM
jgi:hypothetical protein